VPGVRPEKVENEMARDDREKTAPKVTAAADISLIGSVDEAMACKLRDALGQAEPAGEPLTIDMTTLGGDPEMARRMIAEVDAARERLKGRRLVFVGKTAVYSAGCTFMAAFPRADRYLTADATLLIHCRQLQQTIELDGPIRTHIPKLRSKLHEFETGVQLEKDNFERLVEASDVRMDELLEKALHNWYVPAEEARERGLIAGIIGS
jgi:ATP-dependent protease ClpP protease subunit